MTHRLSHSYSAIKLFENCPLRYYKQRIEKSIVDKGSEASAHGERVHKSFEDRIKEKKPLPPELGPKERVVQAIEELGGVLEAEKELVLTSDLTPTTWFADNAWLRTKIDVFSNHGDKAIILDWKTGARRPDFFQLELYAVQAFIHFPELKACNVGFVWLRDETNDTEIYRRRDFEPLLKEVQERIKRIEDAVAEDVWPAKPGPLCKFCPAKDNCMYADTGRGRRGRW